MSALVLDTTPKPLTLDGLMPLSLIRASKGVPKPLANNDRARLFRFMAPAPAYNTHDWPHCRKP